MSSTRHKAESSVIGDSVVEENASHLQPTSVSVSDNNQRSAHQRTNSSNSFDSIDSAMENESFTSHFSSMGRGQGAGADLESIAQANVCEEEFEHEMHIERDVNIYAFAKRFFLLGYPLSISALAQFSFNAVIISVMGRYLGVEQMGGASLALGLVNATGLAFGAGLCGALETVFSHIYGSYKQKERLGQDLSGVTIPMYGIYAQRMALILLVTALPLGAVLCFADKILTSVGESLEVTMYTGIWCRVAMFGIPMTMSQQLIQRYYSCQHVTKPLCITMVIAALVNPVLQLACVRMFGFIGSPIAWLILFFGINATLLFYLYYTGLHRLTWCGWSKKGRKNIYPLVKLAIPSMGVMLSEWVALEINFLAAGFAPPSDLAAYAITYQIFGILWGFASGIIILTSVFVGNAVGEGKPLLARRVAFMAIIFALVISSCACLLLLLVNPYFPYIFTTDPAVASTYERLMYIVLPYHLLDCFQSVVMGILRGCGLQKIGVVIITTAFCVVGVPFSFLLFFYFDLGVKALWIGPFTGAAVVGLPSYLFLLFRYIDWENIKPHTEEAHAVTSAPNQESSQAGEQTNAAQLRNDGTREGRTEVTVLNIETPPQEGGQERIKRYLDGVEHAQPNKAHE